MCYITEFKILNLCFFLADKITESLAENLKRVPPSAVMSVTGVRKAMGIAQVSHLDVSQNNCHPSSIVNHGSSHQQTQVLYFIELFYKLYILFLFLFQ